MEHLYQKKMENNSDVNTDDKRNTANENKEIKEVSVEQILYKNGTYDEIEKDLNAKILAITLKIRNELPELSKYLDEMPVTVPNKKEPHITLNLLKVYYESLGSLFEDYNLEHQKKTE